MQDDAPLTVPMIVRHALSVHGESPIVAAREGGSAERRTFAETGERIHRLAGALRERGVRPGDAVGTLCWNTQAHLEAYFAVPSLGAVLHTINLRLYPAQVAWIIADAADRVLLVDASMWDLALEVLPDCPSVEWVIVSGDDAGLDLTMSPVPAVRYEDLLDAATPFVGDVSDERAPAAMCYTSGTTGHPKGVVYSHRSVYLHAAANLYAGGFGIHDADTVLQVVPMFHANGWGFPYAALLSGAGLVLSGRDLQPETLVELIERERPTVSGGVPTIWRAVFDQARESGADLRSLRLISCAGSAVPESLLRDYQTIGIELYQAWGMTETSPLAAIARPPVRTRDRDEWYWRTRTGRPVPGVEIRVTDERGEPLPNDGESVGELEVRGPWVAAGYYRDRDPDRVHDGWLRTGDVGTIDDAGAMKITDRSKDLIKSGGEWISSTDIEDRLSEIDGVVEAACIGIPDATWSERPLAMITVRPGVQLTDEQVRAHLGATMPRWQHPDRIIVVPQIRRTSVGKIDKAGLRAAHAAGELTGEDLPSR